MLYNFHFTVFVVEHFYYVTVSIAAFIFSVLANKQLWSSSLCHSLVAHTYGQH